MSNAIKTVRWTMADHLSGEVGEFLTLGGIDFDDPDDAERFWNELPEDTSQDSKVDDFNLIADQITTDGDHVADRYVAREIIEKYLPIPFDDAVAAARQENRKIEEILRG